MPCRRSNAETMRRSVCDGLPMPIRRSRVDIKREATVAMSAIIIQSHSGLRWLSYCCTEILPVTERTL